MNCTNIRSTKIVETHINEIIKRIFSLSKIKLVNFFKNFININNKKYYYKNKKLTYLVMKINF